ncbi:MAG: SpoIIE family protein phosphatase [Armatimonadota bacterium]|nr:SpoIIE family protein phosphatase [Armatimonadota bacterium]
MNPSISIPKLKARLMIYVIIALTPLVLLNLLSQTSARKSRLDAVRRSNMGMASSTAMAMQSFVDNSQDMFTAAAVGLATGRIPMEDANGYLAEMRNINPYILRLVVVDEHGIIIASDSQNLIGIDFSNRPWFKTIATEDKTSNVTDLFMLTPEGPKAVAIAVGAYEKGKLKLILSSAIRVQALERLVSDIGMGGGHTAILDSKGRLVAGGFPDLLERPGILNRSYVPGVREAVRGKSSHFENWRDPINGIVWLGAVVPVKNIGWVAVAMQPRQEAMEPVIAAQRRDFAVLLVFAAISLLLAWFFGEQITRPLVRLSENAAQVAAGDLSTRSPIRREDEIGQLATAFNDMAANLEAFSRVSYTATSTLDLQSLLDSIAAEVRRATRFDLCLIGLVDEERKHIRFQAASGARSDLWKDLRIAIGEKACGASVAEKRPIVSHYAAGGDLECREFTEPEHICSALAAPVISGDEAIGALCVYMRTHWDIPDQLVRLVTTMASFAAVGIQNAKLYERERHIAETLQRSFLPDIPDGIGKFEMGHLYKPSMLEAMVGGDFYDFFRIDEAHYGLVIGDVSGKGVSAAVSAVMGKHMLRAFAFEDSRPGIVLQRLNDALVTTIEFGSFITMVYGVLDLDTAEIVYASAGHDPPLLYRADKQSVESYPTGGRVAGVFADTSYETQSVTLQPNDLLLLFTDGITEARRNEEFFGRNGLENAVATYAGSSLPQTLLERMIEHVMDYTQGQIRDDIAMLAIRRKEADS